MRQVSDLPFGWARVAAVSSLAATALVGFGEAAAPRAFAAQPTAGAQTASARPAAQVPSTEEVPSMDNDSLYTPPPPLPPAWPVGAKDAQFRGAACDEGYSPQAAKRNGEAGDDAFPALGQVAAGLPSPYIAVRRAPFLTRRDVLKALFSAVDDGTYEVHLKLTDDGAKKIQEYTAENKDKCIALVAGGKVIWHPSISEPVTDDTFILSGQFTVSQAQAIVSLFNEN
jgi:hypothetical protein